VKLIIAGLITILLGITCTCFGSQAGGEYLTIEDVLEKEKIVAIAEARVNGFKKSDVHEITMSNDKENRDSYGYETVYHSRKFKRLILDVTVVNVISGNLEQKRLQSLIYTEPFFNHTFRLLPNGKQEDLLYSLGFSYTGSGKEFSETICKVGNVIILIIGGDGENKKKILRLESFSEEMAERIKRTLR
jgi:hypothetical protein